jgi:hypothetical protein
MCLPGTNNLDNVHDEHRSEFFDDKISINQAFFLKKNVSTRGYIDDLVH